MRGGPAGHAGATQTGRMRVHTRLVRGLTRPVQLLRGHAADLELLDVGLNVLERQHALGVSFDAPAACNLLPGRSSAPRARKGWARARTYGAAVHCVAWRLTTRPRRELYLQHRGAAPAEQPVKEGSMHQVAKNIIFSLTRKGRRGAGARSVKQP